MLFRSGFISRADGVTISIFRTNDDDLVEDERVLLGFTSNGVNTWKLFLNGVSKASTLIGSYVNPPNRSGELNFGRNAINNNIYYAGGCEAVIIHPTRDLTETEQAHAWALAQES